MPSPTSGRATCGPGRRNRRGYGACLGVTAPALGRGRAARRSRRRPGRRNISLGSDLSPAGALAGRPAALAAGAWVGWWLLRQWPQAAVGSILAPAWLVGEWVVATEGMRAGAAPGAFLLLLAMSGSASRCRGEETSRLWRFAESQRGAPRCRRLMRGPDPREAMMIHVSGLPGAASSRRFPALAGSPRRPWRGARRVAARVSSAGRYPVPRARRRQAPAGRGRSRLPPQPLP